MSLIIEKCRAYKYNLSGPVELVEKNDMGKGLNVLQSILIFSENLDLSLAVRI